MSDADTFLKRFKKISKDIENHARGEDRDNQMKIFKAIDRLEDLTNSGELRGTPENEARWESLKSLRMATRAAEETAYQARVAGRNTKISQLKQEHASRFENTDPYARELTINRRGR